MNRLRLEKPVVDTIVDFSEGNIGCATFLAEIASDPVAFITVLMFADNNEIYGSKLYMLWNDCCGRDLDKVKETVRYLIENNVSKEKIHENLGRGRALPFI